MSDRGFLSIGEVLALLQQEFPDLTISKIRFLESQGLLDPERTPSGYRKFYDDDVERLRWILTQQREHYLPLKVIRGHLTGEDADPPGASGEAGSEARSPAADGDSNAVGDRAAARREGATPPPVAPALGALRRGRDDEGANPLRVVRTGLSMSGDELCEASGLSATALDDLEKFGLITARTVGGGAFYDEEALIVANLAAAFMAHGIEARHLRMYKTAAEREAGFIEQLVLPLLKQRNPRSRQQAVDALGELSALGQSLRAAMLRLALRDHLSQ